MKYMIHVTFDQPTVVIRLIFLIKLKVKMDQTAIINLIWNATMSEYSLYKQIFEHKDLTWEDHSQSTCALCG